MHVCKDIPIYFDKFPNLGIKLRICFRYKVQEICKPHLKRNRSTIIIHSLTSNTLSTITIRQSFHFVFPPSPIFRSSFPFLRWWRQHSRITWYPSRQAPQKLNKISSHWGPSSCPTIAKVHLRLKEIAFNLMYFC